MALTTDTSALTAIGNDYGFKQIFARQVRALARRGDVLLLLSTSGASANIIEAARAGTECGCRTVALLGREGGSLKDLVEHPLIVPSDHTPHIQEMHITIGHILCDIAERHFADNQ